MSPNRTSDSFRRIHIDEYGVNQPVTRGRELAALVARST